jgi:hypothetical protein
MGRRRSWRNANADEDCSPRLPNRIHTYVQKYV